MASVQDFYLDEDTRENVRGYLQQHLEKRAVDKVFAKEDVAGVAEARATIDEAFENLELLFAPKKKKKLPQGSR